MWEIKCVECDHRIIKLTYFAAETIYGLHSLETGHNITISTTKVED